MYKNPGLIKQTLNDEDKKIISSNIPRYRPVFVNSKIPPPKGYNKYDKDGECKPWSDLNRYRTGVDDYKRMVSEKSDGITVFGLSRLTDTILTFIYNVLLAQGKSGYPIQDEKQNGMVGITQSYFKNLHNTRVLSGVGVHNVIDVHSSLALIVQNTKDWTDICKGLIRVPNNLMLYKLKEVGKTVVTKRITNDVVKEVVEVEDEEDVNSDSERSEDNEDSDSDEDNEDNDSDSDEDEDEDDLNETISLTSSPPSKTYKYIGLVVSTVLGIKGLMLINDRLKQRSNRP